MNHITLTFISLSFLVLLVILVYVVRVVISLHRKKVEEQTKDDSEVGFVVDTFHDLVTKLKEKERELESLRKRAEDRASEIEIYNEDILQSVPSGVVSFDQELSVTKMNAAAEKILGLRQTEVVGKGHDNVFGSPIKELLAQRQIVERSEAGYVTASGNRVWLGLNMSPLRDSSGTVIGQILVFTDLTELKAFQSQTELRERLLNLGEMSAGIAHELRNPMAVISGYTRILLKKVDVPLMPPVEAIAREVTVMDRIITDFLAFAKPTELVLSSFELTALIRDCISAARDLHGGVEIIEELDLSVTVTADEVLLRQAITNILQNAIEAQGEGGRVTVAVSRPGDLVIRVSDTGHGIPDSVRDKIFLPFFTTKERGTGLGLSIVHKVVVSHGGSITADSGEYGTTFTISLPAGLGS